MNSIIDKLNESIRLAHEIRQATYNQMLPEIVQALINELKTATGEL